MKEVGGVSIIEAVAKSGRYSHGICGACRQVGSVAVVPAGACLSSWWREHLSPDSDSISAGAGELGERTSMSVDRSATGLESRDGGYVDGEQGEEDGWTQGTERITVKIADLGNGMSFLLFQFGTWGLLPILECQLRFAFTFTSLFCLFSIT